MTSRPSAVKFFTDRSRYARELEMYQVLLERGIQKVAGHEVPTLLRFDDELLAIEMTIVRPPFVLDFAAAKTEYEYAWLGLDEDEVWAEHVERVKEKFDDKWQDALDVADAFARATGYILMDLHAGNIRFENRSRRGDWHE